MDFPRTPLVPFALCALAIAGCQQYRREALDFNSIDRAWSARNLDDEPLATYANRLAQSDGTPRPAFDPSDGLSLREGEAVALFFNPQLRLARVRANVARVGAKDAGRWEDPVLGVDAERILAGVANPWVLLGSLSITLPVSGRLGLAQDHAEGEAGVERIRVFVEEQASLAELRDGWLRWSAVLERVELTNALLTELKALEQAAQTLRRAGELDPTDVRLFEIERVSQQSRLQSLESDARDLELRLRAHLGLTPDAPLRLVPQLHVAASLPTDTAPSNTAAGLNARLRLAQAQYEVAERSLRLEVRKQYPDLTVSGGYGTDEGDERVLFGGSLPLPLLNGNRRAIAVAKANRDAARAAAEAEYQSVVGAAARARERSDAASRRLEFVRRELAPLGDRQLADVRRLGQLGDFNTVLLLQAVKAAHDAKLEVLAARLEASHANNELNSLRGADHPEVRP